MAEANDPMAEIRASFFIECEELLEALQDGLQTMDDGAADSETINIVFRAVHSIKGGAGAFGLTALVRFAHRFETVLDEVRGGRMTADGQALKVFFQAADHVSDLVRASREEGPIPEDETKTLLTELDALLDEAGVTDPDSNEEEIEFQPMSLSLDLDFGDDDDGFLPPLLGTSAKEFRIAFTPYAELFETGNEPFLLLRNLQELGKVSVACDLSQVPELAKLTPEIPVLSWAVILTTEVEESEIASVFEFVEGLCSLTIIRVDGSDTFEPTETPPPGFLQMPEPEEALLTAVETPLVVTAAEPARTEVKAAPAATAKNAAGSAAAKSVVRVDLDRIERLVNLVGELVINQAMLSQSLEHAGLSLHSDAMNGLEEFQRLTRDIQDSVMMIRAQPVKSLFQRMSRIVREASADVGKDVRLITEGENTEVDKTVIERLADPLTHMIRNAVDHGLESSADRIATGKPAQGKVTLTAAHRSGRVVIEVSDDGGGINRPKVLEIAVNKGLVPADVMLSDSEIDNLLFLPGFSTASVVSDLSGRGVGMDVVRTSIQSLGGRITTTSNPGEGTKFSISLPLTLAVLDGMVIDVAGETLVLPLNVVIETLTLSAGDVEMVRPGASVVRIRGEFVPLFDLGEELGYRSGVSDYAGLIVLLIAYDDGHRAALIIDDIQDQRQVVIKGLDDSFYRAPGVAAATILGDGQIALILDPTDIITNAMGHTGAKQANLATGTLS